MLEQSTTAPNPNAAPKPDEPFNWRTCWYPIAFLSDFPPDQPYGFSIYNEAFVLFREASGELVCLEDRCPHRAAKLSDGQILDGRLECLYHGWQFGKDGTCLHIPQLQPPAQIPSRACAKSFAVAEDRGIVWVWPDTPQTATRLPTIPELDQEGVFIVDTATDLPFDHTFLVENLLDPAHVYISHDRTELRIRREDAQPLDIEVLSASLNGFQGRFRGVHRSQGPWTSLDFIAPHFVHYSFSNAAFGVVGGLALYALPLAPGKSRVLVRRYGNIFKRPFTLKPRWLEHLRQNKILEEDLRFIVEQQRYFEGSDRAVKTAYFPLKTCDVFVIEHRKWLDRFGANLPWYWGYATQKNPDRALETPEPDQIPSRLMRHTQQCGSCRVAYRRTTQIQQGATVGAIAFLSLALLSEDAVQLLFTASFVLAWATVGIAGKLKTHFERSYTRT
jgi:phenylpropionate dioxygenase-like ring-hydroxylating dioxygenase large terminal subunit